jgi:beta-mannosidase
VGETETVIDLSGTWKATVATDDLRRRYSEPTFDDADWSSIAVPNHWRSETSFAHNDGALLYRKEFSVISPSDDQGPPDPATRSWLQFDGVFYQGDVWLDGDYLGDTEGYFVPHSFEVTEALRSRTDHLLAIEVTCAPQKNRSSKRNLTGVFQHWDCIHPDWNPGGIWRPVRIVTTGSVRIERLRVLCVEADEHRATLAIRANLDTNTARSVDVATDVIDGSQTGDHTVATHTQQHSLASGMNRVEWRVTIDNPTLWWPHALGEPHLVEVEVRVSDESGQLTDTRRRRTGLRQIRQNNWIYEVNGQRIYMKGANQGPLRMAIAETTIDEARELVARARDAGLDFLRLHAHISHPHVYDAADEAGMMIWQDLPLQWGYSRTVRKPAIEQAREAVDVLGHHPSIIQWSGHNEPLALDIEPGDSLGDRKRAANMIGRYLLAQQLPTWNKSVLDFAIHRSLTRSDPSRPISAHSGILPGPLSGGSDTHLYFGWYHQNERDFPMWLRRLPRLARFLSEFGAQAVPSGPGAAFLEPDKWPDLDWERISATHALQLSFMERNVQRAKYSTFQEWAESTQRYQAYLVRRHIEELRRIKYHPNGGFAMFSFQDAADHPAVTWSVLGHDGDAKLGFEALRAACAPVIVVGDRLPPTLAPGSSTEINVHVVNDLRTTLRNATVVATLRIGSASPLRWTWAGDCPADHVARVGSVPVWIPAQAPVGTPVELRLEMLHDAHQPINVDNTVIAVTNR